ncbi:MAG: non-ribosomal peptide synthetase [Candidatus Hydrogenedentes bacterium]|nr:non-ribosomal peptide synthetase [Candidatus Hydrogenedentota bacterium]
MPLSVFEYDRGSSVARQFERVALHFGEITALSSAGDSLTYDAVNSHANRIAHALTTFGVGRGNRVALCTERSIETIAVLLAILKCGAAYVPLDPAYPPSRLAMMLQDISATLCVVQDSHLPLTNWTGEHCISLQELLRLAERQPDHNVNVEVAPDDLAYIMYTSGSTGAPKGVCVDHRNILRLVCGTDYASFGPDEVFLLLAPLSFDASTFEVWGALLTGARLAIAPAGYGALDDLGSLIRNENVTTLWLTAGLFHQLVDADVNQFRGVRQLLAGGDVLSAVHVKRVLDAIPDLRVINGYGPTECTTFTCCHTMQSAKDVSDPVPIGRVIANTTAYILNDHLCPVPDGTPGELFVGGDGVARGYWNRPELSQEKFLVDPFANQLCSRMYRTGDRVVRDESGVFAFLGRVDRQVKVRGYRIEPGEIERTLIKSGEIGQAVVIATGDKVHEKRLIAYITPTNNSSRDTQKVSAWLQGELPPFMVPSALIWIDSLPLDANGKVDRAALLSVLPVTESGFVAPESELEENLSEIWSEILGVDRVGRYQEFIALGGHSLAAMRVIARVSDSFGVRLPLLALLENSTIESFGEAVEEAILLQVEQLDA